MWSIPYNLGKLFKDGKLKKFTHGFAVQIFTFFPEVGRHVNKLSAKFDFIPPGNGVFLLFTFVK